MGKNGCFIEKNALFGLFFKGGAGPLGTLDPHREAS
jgi:hypothetical protein